jgi:hypothetical protein
MVRELRMGAYELDLFTHSLSVDPGFRAGILAGDDGAWSRISLTADERDALGRADIGWLYEHGANGFLLHNIFRFRVANITVEQYVTSIRAGAARMTANPEPETSDSGDRFHD